MLQLYISYILKVENCLLVGTFSGRALACLGQFWPHSFSDNKKI